MSRARPNATNRPSVSRTAAVARSVLEGARRGNGASLFHLKTVLTPGNFNLDILDILVSHLDEQLVPDVQDEGEHLAPLTDVSVRALHCISALSAVIGGCEKKPSLKEPAVERILQVFDGIIAWIYVLLYHGLGDPPERQVGVDFRNAYFFHAKQLLDLINFDERLLQAILNSISATDLVIKFFITTGKRHACFQNLDNPDGCPIVSLVSKCVESPQGLEAVGTRIFAIRPEMPARVMRNTMERAVQIQVWVKDVRGPSRLVSGTRHFDRLVQLIHRLLKYRPLVPLFATIDKLEGFETLPTIATSTFMHKNFFPQFFTLALNVTTLPITSVRYVKNVMELVHAAFTLFMACLGMCNDAIPDSMATLEGVVDAFVSYSLIPSACFVTHSDIKEVPPSALSPIRPYPAFDVSWKWLFLAITKRWEVFQNIPRAPRAVVLGGLVPQSSITGGKFGSCLPICDNLVCPIVREEFFVGGSKKCTRCSSVVYCSEQCQKEDWKARHKYECDHARVLYIDHKSSQHWYSNKTRLGHMALIEDVFNATAEGLEYDPEARAKRLQSSTNSADRLFDLLVSQKSEPDKRVSPPSPVKDEQDLAKRLPDRIYLFQPGLYAPKLDDYPKIPSGRPTSWAPPYLHKRLNELLAEGSDPGKALSIRYALGVMPWGTDKVRLMVKLRWTQDYGFEALHSVAIAATFSSHV
ncbi:hypothetical protein FA15DRAFT_669820 [Coprinopsis marcescibilis]|uniref:MYND-type domain-containing protein n=1 Tax=Coprinopsis marcescibilis TaxID=230819 RepID=A0A5C3KU78_COPMA|nr:hypothetical protein FA15DRAFT_669820 [Coprinopsis marcescibilis]